MDIQSIMLPDILYISNFLNPIRKLINFVEQYQSGSSGFKRFIEIMDKEIEIDDPGAEDIYSVKGDINFNDVTFAYDDNTEILKDIDKVNDLVDKKEMELELNLPSQLINYGVNGSYAFNEIFSKEMKDYTKKVDVVNGIKGISIITSSFNKNGDGINDIRLNYRINAKVLDSAAFNFRLTNRCYFRSWIGKSIVNNNVENNLVTQEKVYVTVNGTVYHLSKNCTHINIIATKVMESKIENFRNSNGAKYYACELCTKNSKSKNGEVYITAEGKRYHYDSKCGKIDRTVIEISKSEISDKKLCSRCEKTIVSN